MLVVRADTCEAGRGSTSKGVRSVKIIVSACPIHRGCTLELIFGEEEEGRIPFPDPALKHVAEHDFPDLVPIEAKHLISRARAS